MLRYIKGPYNRPISFSIKNIHKIWVLPEFKPLLFRDGIPYSHYNLSISVSGKLSIPVSTRSTAARVPSKIHLLVLIGSIPHVARVFLLTEVKWFIVHRVGRSEVHIPDSIRSNTPGWSSR